MAISYANSLQPFIVLDKNQFRGVNAANAIADAQRQNCQILLIDTVFVEIASAASKGKDWKDQFEKDFRDWVNHPELLVVARGFGGLLRLERDSGASALPALVDSAMTTIIQDAIRDLGVSGVGSLSKYDARMAAQVTKLTSPGEMLDASQNLTALRNLLDVWWKHGLWWSKDKGAALKLLKAEVQDNSATAYEAVALAATSDSVFAGIEDALLQTNTGYLPAVAKRLMSEPSFTMFVWAAREVMSLYYYALGRKSGDITNADRELNQTLDTTYLGYGLGCRQLTTAEHVIRRLDAGFRRVLADRWASTDGTDAKSLHDRREKRAYYHWVDRGRPNGDDWTDWFRATADVTR